MGHMIRCTRTLPRGVAAAALLLLLTLQVQVVRADLLFGPPQFLPGDASIGLPAGMQVESDIALGETQYLAVWSDFRSSPDDYPPFASEGSGADIYAARMDLDGNLVDAIPLVIDQALGDQIEPTVSWNGTAWLVVWKQNTVTLPTYEELLAVRVAPDGSVLDDPPILVHNDESYYSNAVVEGGEDGWVVLFQANGPTEGLIAVRVTSGGAVANPGGLQVHATNFLLDFDLAFALDEYLVVWSGSFDSPRARRYTDDLQLIGTSSLPFAQEVASDGMDFLVVRASGPPPLATVDAVVVTHAGSAQSPVTLHTGGNQDGTCCADVAWDGTHYWVSWGGPRLARVTPDGQVVDPGGFWVSPSTAPISQPNFAGAPDGGVQLTYNDGVSGAAYPKDVHGGRVSTDTQFGNEIAISRGAPAQLEPDFASGDGVHLVSFLSRESAVGRVLVQRIDDAGQALDAEPIEVATGPIPGLGLPSLGAPRVSWNGSMFFVIWSDGLQIFGRRMLPDGSFVDATPLVVMDGHDPDVAALGSVFLVVGLDFLSGNSHWQATHSMRVDGMTGANLDAESNALGGFVIFARHPRVETWGDRWLAVWQRNLSHDDTIAGTTAAFVDEDGTTPGVIDVPLGWRPQVAVSEDVALFVAVTETIASATTDLAAIVMDADGVFQGSSFLVSAAADKQLRPAVAWNGSEFVVAWEDKRSSVIYFDERTDIYMSRVAEDGTVLDPGGVAVADATEPELQPALAAVGGRTLLGASTLLPQSERAAYRVGIQKSLAPTDVTQTPATEESRTMLIGAQPNPTASETSIHFEYDGSQALDLHLYDARGRLVRTLLDGATLAGGRGSRMVRWDGLDMEGRPAGTGVYYYELRTRSSAARGRVIILR